MKRALAPAFVIVDEKPPAERLSATECDAVLDALREFELLKAQHAARVGAAAGDRRAASAEREREAAERERDIAIVSLAAATPAIERDARLHTNVKRPRRPRRPRLMTWLDDTLRMYPNKDDGGLWLLLRSEPVKIVKPRSKIVLQAVGEEPESGLVYEDGLRALHWSGFRAQCTAARKRLGIADERRKSEVAPILPV